MIVKTYDVFCDTCPQWTNGVVGSVSAEKARRQARGYGWVHRDGKDVCPACQTARKVEI